MNDASIGTEYFTVKTSDYMELKLPEMSDWSCYLFGMGKSGLMFTPKIGEEPNAFWRLMQFLCFGHEWFKRKEKQ